MKTKKQSQQANAIAKLGAQAFNNTNSQHNIPLRLEIRRSNSIQQEIYVFDNQTNEDLYVGHIKVENTDIIRNEMNGTIPQLFTEVVTMLIRAHNEKIDQQEVDSKFNSINKLIN